METPLRLDLHGQVELVSRDEEEDISEKRHRMS